MTRDRIASLLASALGYEDSGDTNLFEDDNDSVRERRHLEKTAAATIATGCNPSDNTGACSDDLFSRERWQQFWCRLSASQLPAWLFGEAGCTIGKVTLASTSAPGRITDRWLADTWGIS